MRLFSSAWDQDAQRASPGRQRDNYQSRYHTKSKRTSTIGASKEHPIQIFCERRGYHSRCDCGRDSLGGAHAISSAETPWLVDFLSFPHLTVNFFSDESLGDFGEIGGECAAQFLELGPENPIDKATWRFNDDCLHVHPVISKGPDPVPTTERDKELSGPNVWDWESYLLRRLAAGSIPQECPNAVGCSTSCGLLASRAGAGEKRFDFAELLAQPCLSGILSGHGALATALAALRAAVRVNPRRHGGRVGLGLVGNNDAFPLRNPVLSENPIRSEFASWDKIIASLRALFAMPQALGVFVAELLLTNEWPMIRGN
jgi:hypothetical protein